MRRVYMDANATTPLLPEVMEAMRPYWMERFGNASSIHLHGQQARAAVDRARETLAEFFNCHAAEVVFNSGGTEGDNTAIFGSAAPGDHLITTSIEHSAVLEGGRAMRSARRGSDLRCRRIRTGSSIRGRGHSARRSAPKTRLISVMLANNETGVLQPVEEIGKIAADTGVFFHIDAVQGAGKVKFDVRRFGCHLCSISAHKMHGPKGTGAMFVRRGTPIEPLLVGGSHERRQRAGTENVPGIVGLAKAAELAMHSLEDGTMDRMRKTARPAGGGRFADLRHRREWWRKAFRARPIRPTSGSTGGGRGAGDRAGPEGRSCERRIGLPLRRHRAQPCADGDGPGQDSRPRQPALQLAADSDRERTWIMCCGGARGGGASAGDFAGGGGNGG